jgi:ATP-binding cassette subfamily F protein 3
MISHDRDLLNKAVTSIAHLENLKLTFYRGAYDTFEETRRMQMELNNKAREKTLEQIAHLQSFVDRFRYKASKAKQAQARVKMIERLKPPAAMFDETSAPFSFPDPKRLPAAPMITFDDVSVGYGEHVVLRKITNRIDPEDRIALIGVNGNGKSTFAKLLAGDLKPMGGEMRKSRGLDIAYFAQHQLDKLKPNQTPLEHVVELMPYDSEARRRSRVAQMGLSTSRMDTPAKNLSGGERARLLLGLVTFGGPGMLILDEPTNHLDIDSRDALVAALNDYSGAVLVITHDRHLIDATADKLWVAQNGTIEEYDDDLDAYQRMLTSPGNPKPVAGKPAPEVDRKAQRQDAAQKRAEIAPLRKSIRDAEHKLERLRTEMARVEGFLADPKLYDGAPERVIKLGKDKARFEGEIRKVEDNWLKLSEELEAAQQV